MTERNFVIVEFQPSVCLCHDCAILFPRTRRLALQYFEVDHVSFQRTRCNNQSQPPLLMGGISANKRCLCYVSGEVLFLPSLSPPQTSFFSSPCTQCWFARLRAVLVCKLVSPRTSKTGPSSCASTHKHERALPFSLVVRQCQSASIFTA